MTSWEEEAVLINLITYTYGMMASVLQALQDEASPSNSSANNDQWGIDHIQYHTAHSFTYDIIVNPEQGYCKESLPLPEVMGTSPLLRSAAWATLVTPHSLSGTRATNAQS